MTKAVDKEALDKWTGIELLKCPPFILDRLGEEAVRDRIRREVEQELSRCTDDEFARGFYDYCKIEGTTPGDYKYRILNTPLGEAVASIRFIGGDLEKPAVFLIYRDFDLDTASDIQRVSEFIAFEYEDFTPKRIRWHIPEIKDDLIKANPSIRGDLVYVAGFIDELRAAARPANFDRVRLRKAEGMGWYSDYTAEFDTIFREWPDFVEMARAEEQDTMKDLLDKGLLFEIEIDGSWAGIAAANRMTDNYLSGFCVIEELLVSAFRGQRLAPAVQRHLIEHLPASGDDMLFGTIHYENKPSLRTAMRTGRRPTGMFIFTEIA